MTTDHVEVVLNRMLKMRYITKGNIEFRFRIKSWVMEESVIR